MLLLLILVSALVGPGYVLSEVHVPTGPWARKLHYRLVCNQAVAPWAPGVSTHDPGDAKVRDRCSSAAVGLSRDVRGLFAGWSGPRH